MEQLEGKPQLSEATKVGGFSWTRLKEHVMKGDLKNMQISLMPDEQVLLSRLIAIQRQQGDMAQLNRSTDE